LRPYSPGGTLNALASARMGSNPPHLVYIVYGVGLPGYLILFAPHAFVPQRQYTVQEAAFATGVPPDIYAFHRYTGNSTLLSSTLVQQFRMHVPRLSPEISHPTYRTAYAPFTPSESE